MIEVRIHGRGGQGNVVAAYLLATAAFEEGQYGQAFPAFGAERRDPEYFEPAARADIALLDVDKRSDGSVEIETGLNKNQAQDKAQRCFSCGNCMVCDNCWTLCPDVAVLKLKEVQADGSRYVFDYTYCKGCGFYASECPCGFIAIQGEL